MENIKICPLFKEQCKMEQCIWYKKVDMKHPEYNNYCVIPEIAMNLKFFYELFHRLNIDKEFDKEIGSFLKSDIGKKRK